MAKYARITPIKKRMSPSDLMRLRRKFSITRKGMAEILNVSIGTYWKWERSQLNMSGASLRLIEIMQKYDLWEKEMKPSHRMKYQDE